MNRIYNITGCNGAPAYVWYAINFGVFGVGLVIILLYNLAVTLVDTYTPKEERPVRRITKFQREYIRFHVFCEEIASACNVLGKMMLIILSVLNQISWTIYIIEVSRTNSLLNGGIKCLKGKEIIMAWVDFVINLYFLVHFIIRFIAANSKLRFWICLPSLVDFMTVPSSLFAVTQVQRTVVLNYMRALRFITYTDALVYLRILKNGRHIRFSQLIFTFLGVWCAGTGFLHVLENTGDFWSVTTHAQTWTYWETNYFLLVTMSTVGYGDYYSKTILGRIFVCLFILSALAMFASSIPEIMSIVSETKLSTEDYNSCCGQSHVIVCGKCDPNTYKTFLKGFYHPDYLSSSQLVKMVIFCSDRVDLDTRAVFKLFNAYIHVFDGSVNVPTNLEKVRLKEADGVMVLSSLTAEDGDEEDNANIMRIVSLKIASPDTRVVAILRRYRNKFLLDNFPLWKTVRSSTNLHMKPDLAICLEELKMGLLAQNCLASGAATMLVNLLINVTPEEAKRFKAANHFEKTVVNSWRDQYGYGASLEIYGVNFSYEFDNVPFVEAAEICYKKWSIGLLAVDVLMTNGKRRVVINPSHSPDFVLKSKTMRAFVLAADLKSANQIQHFCYDCHYVNDAQVCDCTSFSLRRDIKRSDSVDTISDSLLTYDTVRKYRRTLSAINEGDEEDLDMITASSENALFDVTGSFHWCNSVDINSVTFTPAQAKERKFSDHIIICLLPRSSDAKRSIGLCNFVMPLRFHYIPYVEMKEIVIIGSQQFLAAHEWSILQNFPKIHILDGNPLNSAHLRAAGIRKCVHCVILTDDKNNTSEVSLADKNAILCGMNAMQYMEDADIKTTIEIVNDDNVHYFSTHTAFEKDCRVAFYLTEPFSRGLVLSPSILYSTLSSAYFSPEGLNFVLSLITGASIDIERMIGEGFGLVPENPTSRTLRYGCQLVQLPVLEAPISEFMDKEVEPPNFGKLFVWAMHSFGIFCLGIYRLRNEVSVQESKMYFVYTFPPKETMLLTSDKIYCLIPPNFESSEKATLDTQAV